MSEVVFQKAVLTAIEQLGGKIDSVASELHEFKESQQTFNHSMLEFKRDQAGFNRTILEFIANQEAFNTAIWSLNTQAFEAINDIRSEVVSPWKIRQSKNT